MFLRKMWLFYLLSSLCSLTICLADTDPRDPRASVFIAAFSQVTRGSPGTLAIDPLFIDYFSGTFATLQYKNYNSTITGLSNCVGFDFILSADGRVLNFALDCPGYTLYSANEVQGYLLYENMIGRGTLEIDYGRYVVRVYAQLSYATEYRNTYYQIGGFFLDIRAIGPNRYNFMHLFNNNWIRNEELNEFANRNWDIAAAFSRETVWYPVMNRIIAAMNHHLRTTPVL